MLPIYYCYSIIKQVSAIQKCVGIHMLRDTSLTGGMKYERENRIWPRYDFSKRGMFSKNSIISMSFNKNEKKNIQNLCLYFIITFSYFLIFQRQIISPIHQTVLVGAKINTFYFCFSHFSSFCIKMRKYSTRNKSK
jgi:hypothetical protein